MKINKVVPVFVLCLPATAFADALFANGIAGDHKLPPTWGVGIDYFNMSQEYQVDTLSAIDIAGFDLDMNGVPEVSGPFDLVDALIPSGDPNILPIKNDVRHTDLHLDVWVTPFLNVFAVYGTLTGDTNIDLNVLGLPLPAATNNLNIDYDGSVFGGGAVLAVGGDRWFGSVTTTFTNTDISGDFKSSVKTTTIQPRIGLRFNDNTDFWIGGYIIDTEEKHSGSIDIDLGAPLLGQLALQQGVYLDGQDVAVEVNLSQKEDFNWSFGTHMTWGEADSWEATVEVGGGDRRTMLANVTRRFD